MTATMLGVHKTIVFLPRCSFSSSSSQSPHSPRRTGHRRTSRQREPRSAPNDRGFFFVKMFATQGKCGPQVNSPNASNDSDSKPRQVESTSELRPEPERTSLADNPWFWIYVFSAAALVALLLASGKYSTRQTQLERRFMARQEGGQTIKNADGDSIETPNEGNLILRLGPLFIICGLLLAVAWSRFWWTRFRPSGDNQGKAMDGNAVAASNALPNPPEDHVGQTGDNQ